MSTCMSSASTGLTPSVVAALDANEEPLLSGTGAGSSGSVLVAAVGAPGGGGSPRERSLAVSE